jgi:signal transduction histidine kinase
LYRLQGSALDRFTTTNGLASDIIWAIHEDSDGALWLGGDCGLQRYRGNRFRHFSRRDGLPHEDVNYILDDDFANLWISSDSGVYRVAKAQLEAVAEGRQPAVTPIVYGLRDGLPSVETNGRKSQPAGCKTRDGRLWFPTIRGVAVFDPKNLPDNPHSPRMVIEQIRADGRSIFHNGPGGVADPAHGDANPSAVQRFDSLQAELRLAPGTAHVLEIHYTANTFIASDKVTFKYRLDGLDPDWIEAGHRRFAQYANLKSGQYRFRVIGVNKYGVAAEQPASFAFYLGPHFYQRRGVRAACLAAAALLAFLAYRWRLGYVRRIHQLERDRALAEDRARIARDLHDGLGAQLTNLTILADTANQQADAAQTIESRFRKLSQLARETAVQLREVIWANHPGDESLEGLISRICQYAEQSLGAAGIRCRFDIPVDLPAAPLRIDARHHIYLAVKEILHNIVKHSRASEVRLQGAILEDSLRLTIEDNGSGLVGSNRHFPNSGHGLQNIRRRIESLAGEVAITGEPGHGVCFDIVVPSAGLFSPRDNGKVNAARSRASHDHASLDRRGRH